jgi:Anti-sigma-K factor rskA/Putative zinc-finger
MTDPRTPGGLRCDEVADLAASFVLDALSDDEMAAVREHLATCAQPHPEFAELGSVVPVLQASLRPMDPPPALKDRIMAAAAADLDARRREAAATTVPVTAAAPPVAAPSSTADLDRPTQPTPIGSRRQPRLSWALGIAAVLAIALIGVWNLSLQSQLNDARAYERQVASVLDAARQPGALTAVMTTQSGAGPNGLAAITADGEMQIAMRDLPATTGDEVYEAWMILPDTAPAALGGVRVGDDGVAYFVADGVPAEDGIVLAVTREPRPGMTAPSSDPVSVGTASSSS